MPLVKPRWISAHRASSYDGLGERRTVGAITAAQARTMSVALGCLCIAFGVISVFTPAGFSWALLLLGVAMTAPWFLSRNRQQVVRRQVGDRTGVPSWHPEYED